MVGRPVNAKLTRLLSRRSSNAGFPWISREHAAIEYCEIQRQRRLVLLTLYVQPGEDQRTHAYESVDWTRERHTYDPGCDARCRERKQSHTLGILPLLRRAQNEPPQRNR